MFEQFTPESQEVTDELTKRLVAVIPADVCVGVTGLTTPGGSETRYKPVGTMFVSMLFNGQLINARWVFEGSIEDIIHQTVDAAAQLIMKSI
ncbi:nicotinamide mononucleotide (NMN) deamidase PncC [Mucilaginibacter terrae]|uniref:Nicotinamide mononucleotide (NMN) deamidase PncC n=1 Tax=Mucilaginibacter terrae TaxID=1955052 RepID=A0ABU3H0D8_9SPHI|nr:nicotinamide mononucleotide (NMN) deamidase PncC [Mucilaginibacter terrae]